MTRTSLPSVSPSSSTASTVRAAVMVMPATVDPPLAGLPSAVDAGEKTLVLLRGSPPRIVDVSHPSGVGAVRDQGHRPLRVCAGEQDRERATFRNTEQRRPLGSDSVQELRELRLLPLHLQMGHEPGDHEQVKRTIADDLVGDAQRTALRISRLRSHRRSVGATPWAKAVRVATLEISTSTEVEGPQRS